MRAQHGYTLIELAISLVIIGLLMGMTLKGRDLIDTARVKSLQAQYGKVLTGFESYIAKYGAYPGDGCSAAAALPSACSDPRDGQLSSTESGRSLTLLQAAGMLNASELTTYAGQAWLLDTQASASGNRAANTSYLTLASGMDARYVCQLDRDSDDANPATGRIRSNGTYAPGDDCWALGGSSVPALQVLP